jgi:hypothetical protein
MGMLVVGAVTWDPLLAGRTDLTCPTVGAGACVRRASAPRTRCRSCAAGRGPGEHDELVGQVRPEFVIAARIRSLASFNVASGKPTSWNRGRPPPTSASISTTRPSIASRATDHVRASRIRRPTGSAGR